MTNAEALIQGLKEIDDDDVALSLTSYIGCPSSENCIYDGTDSTPCDYCKVEWLRKQWED